MTAEYTTPLFNRIVRPPLKMVFRGLFHILARVTIEGKENVPPKGPYLVAINHIALYEPPFVVAFWPVPLEALGAVEIWGKPFQNVLVRLYGGIKVHRGKFDRNVVEQMLAAFRSGYPLLIAPEGGRSHNLGLRKAQPGIAYAAEKVRVPIVPVGITGSTDDFFNQALHGKKPPLKMKIGEPFYLPTVEGKGVDRHQALQENADQVMIKIAALLPPEYYGVYTDRMTSKI